MMSDMAIHRAAVMEPDDGSQTAAGFNASRFYGDCRGAIGCQCIVITITGTNRSVAATNGAMSSAHVASYPSGQSGGLGRSRRR